MYFDLPTLLAVRDEIAQVLLQGYVEQVSQVSNNSCVIQCWKDRKTCWLYFSIHPKFYRIHLLPNKPKKLATHPTDFVMLLRKYLTGSKIVFVENVEQDRILKIHTTNQDKGTQNTTLIIETIGPLSNVFLTNEQDSVLGMMRPHSHRENALYQPYTPPHVQTYKYDDDTKEKINPSTLTHEQIYKVLHKTFESGITFEELGKEINKVISGMSPLFAKEIAFRSISLSGSGDKSDLSKKITQVIKDFYTQFDKKFWKPQILTMEDGRSPHAYAVYDLGQFDGPVINFQSASEMLHSYYGSNDLYAELEEMKSSLRHTLNVQMNRCQRKKVLLQKDLEEIKNSENIRKFGDLLLAQQYSIKPHQSNIKLHDYYSDDPLSNFVEISLDPSISVVENANKYFRRYKKMQRALKSVPEQYEKNEQEIFYIQQLLSDLTLAETIDEIEIVKEEMQDARYLKQKMSCSKTKNMRKSAKKNKPGNIMKLETPDGIIFIGKNSKQNEHITFTLAGSKDYWLHVRGSAGAHVIVKSQGKQASELLLSLAARLAAHYSELQNEKNVPVDITYKKFVEKVPGSGHMGLVRYAQEKTLQVEPADLDKIRGELY